MAPKFVEILRTEAAAPDLSLRVIPGNLFEISEQLGRDYALVIVSAFVGDLRGLSELRQLFELVSERLSPGGQLLLNVHLAVDGYAPDLAAREWAQQCCATFFTRNELNESLSGLPLTITADESAFDFERNHRPEDAWPPTAAFPEWAQGQHMYALEPEESPIELRWLVLTRP
jgi:hypothetical protein